MAKGAKGIFKDYRALSFEQRTLYNTKISLILNGLLAIGKFVLAIFYGVFFTISALVNVFVFFAKVECYLGVEKSHKRSFEFRNLLTSIFLLSMGLMYSIYMARFLITDMKATDYGMIISIIIAMVSFIELSVAIIGCFKAAGRGHYYRNIKLINLSSAFTAIALTEVALMTFAGEGDSSFINGLFGLIVGLFIILIAIYMLFAPKISLVDKEHNKYILKENSNNLIKEENIKIKLTSSKFYADYYYEAKKDNNIIDGYLIKGKIPIFKWKIWVLIIVFTLSEILIFPYVIGAFINYVKNAKLIKKLDMIMLEKNYIKLEEVKE